MVKAAHNAVAPRFAVAASFVAAAAVDYPFDNG
jgi:hypothetical protein